MTEEERVKKWSRGISEMDELSMEEKKIVCHQTAMQMVILWGTLEVIVYRFPRMGGIPVSGNYTQFQPHNRSGEQQL